MSMRSTLKLPKEHGAWAMFYVPFVLGVTVAGKIPLSVFLLLLATSALFVSRESLLIWWRAQKRGRRTENSKQAGRLLLIYGVIAGLSSAPLILVYRFYWLLPLAMAGCALLAVNGKQAMEFEDRSLQSELIAIAGLTMTAPAAYSVARGEWDQTALWLWLLSATYFASSVFYVKLLVTGMHAKRPDDKLRARQQCIVYHSFLVVSLVALAVTHSLPIFVLIAFAPVLIRTIWSFIKPTNQLNLKRIGIAEIIYSLIFLIFTAMTFRYS